MILFFLTTFRPEHLFTFTRNQFTTASELTRLWKERVYIHTVYIWLIKQYITLLHKHKKNLI
jgi:hypothetical protein